MANPQGAIHDRLRSFLGANEPTEAKAEAPVEAKTEEAETPKSDTQAESRRVKAKLNDRDVEFEVLTDGVDLDLIPKGLMMEADYRKKTTEVAEKRKALEAKEAEIASQLQEIESLLYGEAQYLDSDEMRELQESDPEEYYRQRTKFDNKLSKVKGHKEKLEKEFKQKQEQLMQAERAKWKEVVPEWLDENKMNDDLKKMSKTLSQAGFSDQDMGAIYDHRLIQLIRKASLYDELKSKPLESKRERQPPRSQRAGGGEPVPQKKSTARDRLKKTGTRSDAQAAFKDFLGL